MQFFCGDDDFARENQVCCISVMVFYIRFSFHIDVSLFELQASMKAMFVVFWRLYCFIVSPESVICVTFSKQWNKEPLTWKRQLHSIVTRSYVDERLFYFIWVPLHYIKLDSCYQVFTVFFCNTFSDYVGCFFFQKLHLSSFNEVSWLCICVM